MDGIAVRGHRVTVDQPVTGGGPDSDPIPAELFVAIATTTTTTWRTSSTDLFLRC